MGRSARKSHKTARKSHKTARKTHKMSGKRTRKTARKTHKMSGKGARKSYVTKRNIKGPCKDYTIAGLKRLAKVNKHLKLSNKTKRHNITGTSGKNKEQLCNMLKSRGVSVNKMTGGKRRRSTKRSAKASAKRARK